MNNAEVTWHFRGSVRRPSPRARIFPSPSPSPPGLPSSSLLSPFPPPTSLRQAIWEIIWTHQSARSPRDGMPGENSENPADLARNVKRNRSARDYGL